MVTGSRQLTHQEIAILRMYPSVARVRFGSTRQPWRGNCRPGEFCEAAAPSTAAAALRPRREWCRIEGYDEAMHARNPRAGHEPSPAERSGVTLVVSPIQSGD
jgi:hypothetical protein